MVDGNIEFTKDGIPKTPDELLKEILPEKQHAIIEKELLPIAKARLLIFAIEKLFGVKISLKGLEDLITQVSSLFAKALEMAEKITKLVTDLMDKAKEAEKWLDRIMEDPVAFLDEQFKAVFPPKTVNTLIKHTLPAVVVSCLSKPAAAVAAAAADGNSAAVNDGIADFGKIDKLLIEGIRTELAVLDVGTLRVMAGNLKAARDEFNQAADTLEGAKKFFLKALPNKCDKIIKVIATKKDAKMSKKEVSSEDKKAAAKEQAKAKKEVRAELNKERKSVAIERAKGMARKSVKLEGASSLASSASSTLVISSAVDVVPEPSRSTTKDDDIVLSFFIPIPWKYFRRR